MGTIGRRGIRGPAPPWPIIEQFNCANFRFALEPLDQRAGARTGADADRESRSRHSLLSSRGAGQAPRDVLWPIFCYLPLFENFFEKKFLLEEFLEFPKFPPKFITAPPAYRAARNMGDRAARFFSDIINNCSSAASGQPEGRIEDGQESLGTMILRRLQRMREEIDGLERLVRKDEGLESGAADSQ